MLDTPPRKLRGPSVVGRLDITDRLGGGATNHADLVVIQLDGQGRVADRDGDGLVFVCPAERDLLAADHHHPGVGGPSLDPDRFGRGSVRWFCRADATQSSDLVGSEWVLPGPQKLAGLEVVEHQHAGLIRIPTCRPPRISAANSWCPP